MMAENYEERNSLRELIRKNIKNINMGIKNNKKEFCSKMTKSYKHLSKIKLTNQTQKKKRNKNKDDSLNKP